MEQEYEEETTETSPMVVREAQKNPYADSPYGDVNNNLPEDYNAQVLKIKKSLAILQDREMTNRYRKSNVLNKTIDIVAHPAFPGISMHVYWEDD